MLQIQCFVVSRKMQPRKSVSVKLVKVVHEMCWSGGSRSRPRWSTILPICMIITIVFAQSVASLPNDPEKGDLMNNVSTVSTSTSVPTSTTEDYYYDYDEGETKNGTSWRDRNWRRQDNSKIAQVVVYCSVIVIALAGVLIKYFVTQYESSQMKAQQQLDYQRLQNA